MSVSTTIVAWAFKKQQLKKISNRNSTRWPRSTTQTPRRASPATRRDSKRSRPPTISYQTGPLKLSTMQPGAQKAAVLQIIVRQLLKLMEDLTTTTRHEREAPTLTIAKKEALVPVLGRKASRATNRGKSPARITTITTDTKTHDQMETQTTGLVKAVVLIKKSIKLALSRKTRKAVNSTAPMAATLNMRKTNSSRAA